MASQWFPFYWGDYKRDTASLSLAEHGAYLHMLGELYVSKSPLDPSAIYRICHAFTPDEHAAVDKVLKRFMTLTQDGYVQERALREIAKSTRLTGRAKQAAEVRWGPDQAKSYLNRSERLEAGRQLGRHTAEEWQALLQALGTNCLKCGAMDLVKDHIIPLYKGGSDGIENLQPLCGRCNGGKGADTKDYRPEDWVERIQKLLPADWIAPAQRLAPHPHPHPHPDPQPQPQKPKAMSGVEAQAVAIRVLAFLNEQTGRNYQAVEANTSLVVARLKDGFTEDQLRQVIVRKARKWKGDENMDQYLRPKTLFNKTNFANYAGELVAEGGR